MKPTTRKSFELDAKITGKNPMTYMAGLLKQNDDQKIEIERGKLAIGILKQMNNRSRLLLDAAKYELKEAGVDSTVLKEENTDTSVS